MPKDDDSFSCGQIVGGCGGLLLFVIVLGIALVSMASVLMTVAAPFLALGIPLFIAVPLALVALFHFFKK